MKRDAVNLILFTVVTLVGKVSLPAQVVFEVTSPYHHIRVVDHAGLRTLCFDDATETQMSLQDPLKGHFEYTEYFHAAWLWNPIVTNVLMLGLGGASAQRAFEHYHPGAKIETVEIDPMVVQAARDCFHFAETDLQKVNVSDGRMFLRRSVDKYDLILLDAYVGGRYGSGIPQHLATKEFFEVVRSHLTTNGVVAYNVIGTVRDWHADIVGAIYRTLKTVFPQVYLFPAKTSRNVVIVATLSRAQYSLDIVRLRAAQLVQAGRITVPGFRERMDSFQSWPPPNAAHSPILTDDYAPVEGLVGGEATTKAPAGKK